MPQPTRDDFEHLLAFRVSLRRFQRWTEDQAQAAGLTQAQHQLLVAIKGIPEPSRRRSAIWPADRSRGIALRRATEAESVIIPVM